MKVVILATSGFGSRLSEETDMKPKPMVKIGERAFKDIYGLRGYSYGDYPFCYS